jgi:tritrans,polycis-undecaprenyl-diphosphate synthase [geranylgeranyl-diphosphate specific]
MFRTLIDPLYERILRIQCPHIPRHIAIIQDGNRRFAKLQNLPRRIGHLAGADRTEQVLDWAHELNIQYITLYSFSTENFSRDPEEIKDLFAIFKEKFERVCEDPRVRRYGIRVQVVGDRSRIPPDLLGAIERAEEKTAQYRNYYLNVALAYGGRNEIVNAARSILRDVRDGRYSADAIDTDLIEEHLHAGIQLPPVDLIIRTGNEWRTSNFLPWLANGHECAVYFCAPYWPMFRKIDLLRAIRVYSQRVESITGTGVSPGKKTC